MSILSILEANTTRCMDDEADRVALASALRIGIADALRIDVERREAAASALSPDGMIGCGGVLQCHIDAIRNVR